MKIFTEQALIGLFGFLYSKKYVFNWLKRGLIKNFAKFL